MRSISPSNLKTPTTTTTNTLAPTGPVVVMSSTSSSITSTPSPWHSPIPYLFGGLATIMGLIAFALLMLACSYWKLTRTQDMDLENNTVKEGDDDPQNKEPVKVYEEKILVIMAGDEKPTFLATPFCPISSSSSSYGQVVNFNIHKNDPHKFEEKEIIGDNHVLVVPTSTQENGSSHHEQQHSQ